MCARGRALTSPMESKPSSWLSSSSMVRWISRSPPLCASYRFVPIASISSAGRAYAAPLAWRHLSVAVESNYEHPSALQGVSVSHCEEAEVLNDLNTNGL